MANTHTLDEYSDEAIQSLSDREHVRERMGMYIGSKGIEGLHHVILELISNGVDEHLGGFASDIWVIIKRDKGNTVVVRDNGRGIPIGMSTTSHGEEMPTPQMVSTVLKAGGKFGANKNSLTGYGAVGGTHGIGMKAAAFLSTELVIDIWRDGKHYHQEFHDGAAVIDKPVIKDYKGELQGTQISYAFDPICFTPDTHVDAERVLAKLEEVSYPCPDLTLHFDDERADLHETIHHPRGIEELVERLVGEDNPLFKKPLRFTKSVDLPAGHERNWLKEVPITVSLDLALLPTDNTTPGEHSACYANVIPNPDGGEHLSGVKIGLARAMKTYMSTQNLTKAADQLESGDILQGLCLAVSASLPEPSFAGQHKSKLDTTEISPIFADMVREWLADWLPAHDKDAKAWARSIEEFREARIEFKKTKQTLREQRGGRSGSLSAKLAPHTGSVPYEQAEIFLVEGDSAGGTAKQARDNRYQAIFPLRGKPLNVQGQKLSRIVANTELSAVTYALGMELRGEYNPADVKYGKIVMLADADPDGGHISLLLLTFWMQEFPQLIRDGRLWLARPPLFLAEARKGRKGVSDVYLFDDEALAKWQHDNRNWKADYAKVKRFKGLGEMNKDQLKHVAFNPETRFLYQVTIGDISYGTELMTGLMGKDASFKREWLRRYAHELAGTQAARKDSDRPVLLMPEEK